MNAKHVVDSLMGVGPEELLVEMEPDPDRAGKFRKPLPAESAFASVYCALMDAKAAAKAVGYKKPKRAGELLLGAPEFKRVQREIEARLVDLEERANLTAEYVRDYMFSVLDFCPTDYFSVSPEGEWCIDPKEFQQVPHRIRRLVESVDLKVYRERTVLTVKFVSKSNVLAMAAKYTLTQALELSVRKEQLPWDEIVKQQDSAPDTVERKMEELLDGPARAPGSAQAKSGAVA